MFPSMFTLYTLTYSDSSHNNGDYIQCYLTSTEKQLTHDVLIAQQEVLLVGK